RVANVDSVPIRYIVAEQLSRSGVDTPALPDAPTRRLVKEGPTGPVYQVTLAPHTATELHTHAAPGLTVLAIAGTLADEGNAPAATGGTGPGRWIWRNSAHQHLLRNNGTDT